MSMKAQARPNWISQKKTCVKTMFHGGSLAHHWKTYVCVCLILTKRGNEVEVRFTREGQTTHGAFWKKPQLQNGMAKQLAPLQWNLSMPNYNPNYAEAEGYEHRNSLMRKFGMMHTWIGWCPTADSG